MKRLLQLLLLVALMFGFTACENESDDNNSGGDLTVNAETISAKWLITEASSEYKSIEFNESGNYILQMEDGMKSTEDLIVLFGTYIILDDNIIQLSDFGTITINSLDNNSISITISPAGGSEVTIEADKADDIIGSSSSRTDLLCRSWEMVAIDGEPVTGTEFELTVIFSKAGTYFVEYANPVYGDEGGLAQWQWKDSDEEMFCYSWDGAPTCTGENEVTITELTSVKLVIIEYLYDETFEYELAPTGSTKSAHVSKAINLNKKLRSSFLNK
ncbi:MAG TPA: hypothetical protein DDX98_00880 [Bacteroidales bacterium]|nr:hypothetical protein [Bacteroidales bacterium]